MIANMEVDRLSYMTSLKSPHKSNEQLNLVHRPARDFRILECGVMIVTITPVSDNSIREMSIFISVLVCKKGPPTNTNYFAFLAKSHIKR